ncbi:MAG: DUF6266 family protein [Candidatus Pedobacter colombiensis]|uniref:DUF6266 family protein n=1 Tax=Candidatus Pedobacter colombiensis TaxID=3121371 RepID=A0AAJ5W606_9SPHI|nr:DUF6266 family protein [Pedobacter sp.]WEK17785.1 MAG: DUF6266 family protein [Pedobacter sp.]
MGILRSGIFGGFEKKTGRLVGRRLKDKSVISGTPHKSTKARSQAQLEQQLKLELVISFLVKFSNLIAVGFRKVRGKGNAFNTAVKHNFKHIVTGIAPNFTIDYTRMVYSVGSLAGPNQPELSLMDDVVQIRWLPDVQMQFSQNTDKASFTVYCPDKDFVITKIGTALRSALSYHMVLPSGLSEGRLHCFMNFVSADGKWVSNSTYLGTI